MQNLDMMRAMYGDDPLDWPVTWRELTDIIEGLEANASGQDFSDNPQIHAIRRLSKLLEVPELERINRQLNWLERKVKETVAPPSPVGQASPPNSTADKVAAILNLTK